jgi:hypothetical protein
MDSQSWYRKYLNINKMIDGNVSIATKISLLIQTITGILGLYGLTIPVASKDIILKQVLGLEMIVQVIEFIFYLGFLNVASIVSLTQKRYHDWFLSTPVMLFTTALYFYYVNNIENSKDEDSSKFNINTFAKSNSGTIILFLFLNFLMLLFGYLAELGYINRGLAFVFGTGALCCSFGIIYQKFAKYSEKTRRLFWIMFSIWLLYGVAFLLP